MTEPVATCRPHYPVRPDQISPDWVVHLAAQRARVDRECEPVPCFGPSFEQVKLEQQAAVGDPVSTLVRKAGGMSEGELFAVARQVTKGKPGPLPVVTAVEKVLVSFIAEAHQEGNELRLARIRDAKTTAFLRLAAPVLPPEFLTAALRTRSRGAPEATKILANLGSVSGLQERLAEDVKRAVVEGRDAATQLALRTPDDLAALVARAKDSASAAPRKPLTVADQQAVAFAQRLAVDTPFRIGAYAALFSAKAP